MAKSRKSNKSATIVTDSTSAKPQKKVIHSQKLAVPTSTPGPSPKGVDESIAGGYPQAIAALDRQIVSLVEQRVELFRQWSEDAASHRKQVGAPPAIWDQSANIEAALPSPASECKIPRELTAHLLRTVSGVTHFACDSALKVAYLGPMYSYSYLARSNFLAK